MAILDNPQEDINTSNVSFMPTAQKWGLYFAAGSVIFTILISIVGFKFDSMMSLGIFGLISGLFILALYIVCGIGCIREYRTSLGGFISFKQAFLAALVAFSIGLVVSSLFTFIYYNYINTGFMEGMKESMITLFDDAGLPESSRADALKGIEDSKTVTGTLMSIAKGVVGSAVISAIMAAIMKKERPMFA